MICVRFCICLCDVARKQHTFFSLTFSVIACDIKISLCLTLNLFTHFSDKMNSKLLSLSAVGAAALGLLVYKNQKKSKERKQASKPPSGPAPEKPLQLMTDSLSAKQLESLVALYHTVSHAFNLRLTCVLRRGGAKAARWRT